MISFVSQTVLLASAFMFLQKTTGTAGHLETEKIDLLGNRNVNDDSDTPSLERLCWEDEFNDLKGWSHMVTGWRGGNEEFQYYRNNRKNSYVKDGILHIKPTLTATEYGEDFLEHGTLNLNNNPDPDARCNYEPCTIKAGVDIINPIQSARMNSNSSFTFRYGRVEVKAKMPRGDWLWPAIWMLPSQNVYGGYPRSGEIDLTEIRGNKFIKFPYSDSPSGINETAATLHWGIHRSATEWSPVLVSRSYSHSLDDPTKDLSDDFHLYGMEWTEKYFRFTLDGVVYGEFKIPPEGLWKYGGFEGENIWGDNPNAPFDQEFYFILNVAVGGNFFPDNTLYKPCEKPWLRTDEDPI